MFVSPLVKATLQATALATGSNVIAQVIEARQHDRPFLLDILALLRFVVMTLMTTPPNYKWQQFLEHTFPGYPEVHAHESLPLTERDVKHRGIEHEKEKDATKQNVRDDKDHSVGRPKRKLSLRNTLLKWFIDCITVGALVNTVVFLLIMGGLKGHHMPGIRQNISKETIPIILAGYKVWPFASIISFTFVPVERRIVFLSFIGFLWGIYMSLVATRV